MKRFISFIILFALASQFCITSSAESEFLYKDKYKSVYKYSKDYKELYYHKDKNDDTDWVMIFTDCMDDEIIGAQYGIFDDVFFYEWCYCSPFKFGICIYDVKSDCFFDLIDAWKKDFSGLHEALYEVISAGKINKNLFPYAIIGDIDKDYVLTIKDATLLQKIFAELVNPEEYFSGGLYDYEIVGLYGPFEYSDRPSFTYYIKEYDYSYEGVCLWDYNSDGKLNIKDATAIQKKIAKVS